MQTQPQSFYLQDLSANDVEAIMRGLDELPSKVSRNTMNKVETQIIQQVHAQQQAQMLQPEQKTEASSGKKG